MWKIIQKNIVLRLIESDDGDEEEDVYGSR